MNIDNQLNTHLFTSTVKLLKNNAIPFWLDTKSLLTVIGKKHGLSLFQDRNVSLSIPGEHFSNLLTLENELGLSYRFQLVPDQSGREWTESGYCRIAVLSRWQHKQKAFKIFITPKYKVENKYRWVDKRSCKEIESTYYDKLDEINFSENSFPIPQNTEDYLRVRFGNDWKNPNLNWIASIDDNTIVNNFLLEKIPFKKVINASP